jgi:hypothetical protein
MMAGYRPHERQRITRDQFVASALAIVAAVLCLVFAAATVRVGVPLLERLLGKVSLVAPVMWILASTFLMRANAASPTERFSPRTLRLIALLFLLMGLGLMIAAALL